MSGGEKWTLNKWKNQYSEIGGKLDKQTGLKSLLQRERELDVEDRV